MMTDQKKLEIRFLVRTPISYIRRGPFPSLACDSMRGASLTVHTQARPPGPALADAPEAHLCVGWAPRPAVRDEEGDPAERGRHRRADRAGLVVAEADGPARGRCARGAGGAHSGCAPHPAARGGSPARGGPARSGGTCLSQLGVITRRRRHPHAVGHLRAQYWGRGGKRPRVSHPMRAASLLDGGSGVHIDRYRA